MSKKVVNNRASVTASERGTGDKCLRVMVRTGRKHRSVYEHPRDSGIWWVQYFAEGRRRREKVGSKSAAIARYQQRKTEAREGRLPPKQRNVQFAHFVREYLESEKAKLLSFRDYARYGRVWSERFGNQTLRSILPMDIEKWVTKRSTGVSPATVNRELAFLRRLFNVGLANGLVERNPVKAVKFLREPSGRVRFLDDDEEARLRAVVGERDWPLVGFAINTGLRQGEQFNLQWRHVNMAKRLLTIPRSKHGGVRHVPLNDNAMAILRNRPTRLHSRFVFASSTGKTPIHSHNFLNRVFYPAVRRAGLEDLRWHDLRHTFASRLVMKGVDLRTVQELLGHKTLAMTVRYSHLAPGHLQEAVRRLDSTGGSFGGTRAAGRKRQRTT